MLTSVEDGVDHGASCDFEAEFRRSWPRFSHRLCLSCNVGLCLERAESETWKVNQFPPYYWGLFGSDEESESWFSLVQERRFESVQEQRR